MTAAANFGNTPITQPSTIPSHPIKQESGTKKSRKRKNLERKEEKTRYREKGNRPHFQRNIG